MLHSDSPQPPPLPNQELPPPLPSAQKQEPDFKQRNTLGIISLIMVGVAAVCTPTGVCGIPLVILVLVGLIGAFLGLISLFKAPRWPGLASIGLFIVCLIIWIAMAIAFIVAVSRLAHRMVTEYNRELDRTQARMQQRDNPPDRPAPTADHIATLSSAAAALSAAAESQRNPDGSAATFVNLSEPAGVPQEHQNDPWGTPYRYRLVDSSRGYTFVSNGPDGIADNADDIDLFDLSAAIRKRKAK